MSVNPPPSQINDIYNPDNFSSNDTPLTIDEANQLYLKLNGGIINGPLFVDSNLSISNDLSIIESADELILAYAAGSSETITFPASTGTVALLSDIPSLVNYVDLTTAQNITGVKTFDNSTLKIKEGIYNSTFTQGTLSSDIVLTLPNSTGSIALLSDITNNDSLTLKDGLSTLPSLNFTSDTGAGMYYSTLNTLSFSTGTAGELFDISGSSNIISLKNNVSEEIQLRGTAFNQVALIAGGNTRLIAYPSYVGLFGTHAVMPTEIWLNNNETNKIKSSTNGIINIDADDSDTQASSAINLRVDNSTIASIDSKSLFLNGSQYMNQPVLTYNNIKTNTGLAKMGITKQAFISNNTTKLSVDETQSMFDHIPNPYSYYDFVSDLVAETPISYFIDKAGGIDFDTVVFAGLTPVEYVGRNNVLYFNQTAGAVPTLYAQRAIIGTDYQTMTNLSISVWVNFTNTSASSVILSFSDTAAASTELRLFETNGDIRFAMRNNGVSQFDLTCPININDGEWHHITAVCGLDRGAELWVDNSLEDSSASTASLNTINIDQLMIGGNEDSGALQWGYSGYLSDVSLFDRTVSTDEINYLGKYLRVGRDEITSTMPITVNSLTVSNQPRFYIESTGTQSINDITQTTIIETGGAWGSPVINNDFTWTALTGILTINSSGTYSLSCEMDYDANATGQRSLYIMLNGSSTDRLGYQLIDTASSGNTHIATSLVYDLAVSDTLQVVVYQSSGGALNAAGTGSNLARFSVVKLF